jgi:hypothetical protein
MPNFIDAQHYDGNWQSGRTPAPVIERDQKVRIYEGNHADARQWGDVSAAAKRGGCSLEYEYSYTDGYGQGWDVYVATPCDSY